MADNKALSYLDLVVATVQGKTPILEFQQLDRTAQAKADIDKLRQRYKSAGVGGKLINRILGLSTPFLMKSWKQLSPAALSMCGDKTIHQLREALQTLEQEDIAGDYIEAGVWRGGLPIIMRAFLQQAGNTQRKVYLADSFQGLPTDVSDVRDKAANALLEPMAQLAVNRTQVEQAFEFFGLNDEQVEFVEGWFDQTLPAMEPTPLALVRLDGDYYESTRDAINALYPRLSVGGYLIIDDYNLPLGCKKAIKEYRREHGITDKIIKINKQAVYWRKS